MVVSTKKDSPQRQRRSCNKMVEEAQTWWNQIPYPLGKWPTNWRIIIPKKFFHCCEGSEPYVRPPRLGIRQKDWASPGNLTLKASGIWLQDFHRTGGNTFQPWRAQTNSCAHQDWKGAAIRQETEPNLPATIGGLPWRHRSAGARHRAGGTGAAVLESPHWLKPCWRSPLSLS